jgi:hypothetical protein
MSGRNSNRAGACPVCGRRILINPSGQLRMHLNFDALGQHLGIAPRCNGSGKAPADAKKVQR